MAREDQIPVAPAAADGRAGNGCPTECGSLLAEAAWRVAGEVYRVGPPPLSGQPPLATMAALCDILGSGPGVIGAATRALLDRSRRPPGPRPAPSGGARVAGGPGLRNGNWNATWTGHSLPGTSGQRACPRFAAGISVVDMRRGRGKIAATPVIEGRGAEVAKRLGKAPCRKKMDSGPGRRHGGILAAHAGRGEGDRRGLIARAKQPSPCPARAACGRGAGRVPLGDDRRECASDAATLQWARPCVTRAGPSRSARA